MNEIRTRPAPELDVPAVFSRLRGIVYNLWWSWSPEAHQLFDYLNPVTWRHYRNPIDVLIDVDPSRWETLADDPFFTEAYHAMVQQFDHYMARQDRWFQRQFPDHAGGTFAYFSMEYGWHECLPIYSGGLGVLAGDHCKSASDLGLPFVGVGLVYRRGFFRQTIDSEGFQQHFYPDLELQRLPLLPVVDAANRELHVAVELPGRELQLRLWKASIGRVPVLLLDSNLPINHPADRPITSILYVQGREMRLCQEIVLGIGGCRALAALGIEPAAWHINEGHSSLLLLERLRGGVERGGLPVDEALRSLDVDTIFSTHTPVPAGNESYDFDLVRRGLSGWCAAHRLDVEALLPLGRAGDDPADRSFNLTALALRSCSRSNGVSQRHAAVADGTWRSLLDRAGRPRLEHVTNGVHLASWIGPEIGELLREHLGADFEEHLLETGFADAVAAIPDHELWHAHLAQKRRLIGLTRERLLQQFARHGRSPDELRAVEGWIESDVLTVGFARRFATYKRADLILSDLLRLRALVGDANRPLQLIFAGMAHPADRGGQELVRRICQAALAPELRRHLVFLEGYDMRVSRQMVQGVDLWLNNPRPPNEACGTSGMKAAMNGVLHCSVLDGWWWEGFDPDVGWKIGDDSHAASDEERDRADAASLYHVLADEIVPCFYERSESGLPVAWIRRMKLSIGRLTPRFSSRRMVGEYVERYYRPIARGALQQPT